MSNNPEVIVVGAGVAGLAAAGELARAGLKVLILEARDRIGGRVFTTRDTATGAPVEFGAEFIHGRPREVWQPLQRARVSITEVDGDEWCNSKGQLAPCDFSAQVDHVLNKMTDSVTDQSFQSFLDGLPASVNDAARHRALSFVSGFNAADPALVGVHWLLEGIRADQIIQGDRAFRCKNGYADLMEIFRRQLTELEIPVQTSTVVREINWQPGNVEICAQTENRASTFTADRVLLTLPLGVLKANGSELGSVNFSPALPEEKIQALGQLEMGKVIRVVLCFRHRFWEDLRPQGSAQSLSNMSFLLADEDEWFPTWWTTFPANFPVLTGWAPFRHAERLSAQSREFVVDRGLESLSRLFNVSLPELRHSLVAAYTHDWQSDPFSRGAYSYAKAGSAGAQQTLADPLENTLFFAGEATDVTGHNGTVHGAMASGYRAAMDILQKTP